MFFWFLFAVILQSLPAFSINNIPTVIIEPDQLYCGEKLHNGESVYYHLTKLQRNTGYELRISYPAMIPTEFIIKDISETVTTGRKLMNIEKLIFYSGSDDEGKIAQVTAFRVGVPAKPNLIEQPVEYDINSLYGGLPYDVWKVVACISLIIFIVMKYCLKPSMNWVNDEADKLE